MAKHRGITYQLNLEDTEATPTTVPGTARATEHGYEGGQGFSEADAARAMRRIIAANRRNELWLRSLRRNAGKLP